MIIRTDSKSIDTRQARSTVGVGADVRRAADQNPVSASTPIRAESGAQVSELSARLLSVEQKMAAEAPFDAERVAKAKAEIKAGLYKIDPEKVVDVILESAVFLSSKN